MAVSVTVNRRADLGVLRTTLCDIVLDNSYPTGGYSIPTAAVGLDTIEALEVFGGGGGYVYDFNPVTDKLKIYWTGAAVSGVLAEVTAATNLSAVTVRAIVHGQ
jgi:hypothetical protein